MHNACCVKLAHSHALAASYAFCIIYNRRVPYLFIYVNGIVRTMLLAGTAAYALLLCNLRLSLRVKEEFAAYTCSTHTQVLKSTAKAGHLVPLEVRHRDNHICIGNSCSNLCARAILATLYRHLHILRALNAICNNNWRIYLQQVVSVVACCVEMVNPVGPATGI